LTLLVGWQEGHPACKKIEWLGTGVVICLEQDADLHMAQLMPLPLTVSCFSKSQIGFTILVPAHPGSPGQRAIKRVCVCVSGTRCEIHLRLAAMIWIHCVGVGLAGVAWCLIRSEIMIRDTLVASTDLVVLLASHRMYHSVMLSFCNIIASTRSSSFVTLNHSSTSSSLRISGRSFQYASPRLWNQLPSINHALISPILTHLVL